GLIGAGPFDVSQFCETEIEYLNCVSAATIRFEPDVIGFEIAMNDSLLMSFFDGGRRLIENVNHPIDRKLIFFREDVGKRAAVEVLHYQISDSLAVDTRKTE